MVGGVGSLRRGDGRGAGGFCSGWWGRRPVRFGAVGRRSAGVVRCRRGPGCGVLRPQPPARPAGGARWGRCGGARPASVVMAPESVMARGRRTRVDTVPSRGDPGAGDEWAAVVVFRCRIARHHAPPQIRGTSHPPGRDKSHHFGVKSSRCYSVRLQVETCSVPGARCPVPGARCSVLGAWCLVSRVLGRVPIRARCDAGGAMVGRRNRARFLVDSDHQGRVTVAHRGRWASGIHW